MRKIIMLLLVIGLAFPLTSFGCCCHCCKKKANPTFSFDLVKFERDLKKVLKQGRERK